MREVDPKLAAFTSGLARRLSECATERGSPPLLESFGTLLQVDIAGSSALAEEIAAEHSADEFAALLNACFSCIVSTIQSFGGEVVEFAGDSVIALWEHKRSKQSAARSIRCAATAALSLNQFISTRHFDLIESVVLRSALSTGPILIAGVGGLQRDRRLFMTGRAIGDLALAIDQATPATVSVSAMTWKLGQDLLSSDGQSGTAHLLKDVAEPEVAAPEKIHATSNLMGVQSYIPKNIRQISDATLVEWLAELRTTTMVFCRLTDKQVLDKSGVLKIHKAVRLIQAQCKKYQGMLETVRADDKGTTLMAAFGLPLPSSIHRRSGVLDFAQNVAQILRSFDYEPGIGIATGRVFQGPVGAAQRQQFAFVGSTTILGCRLMQISCSDILCDEATKVLAETDAEPWSFQEHGSPRLKGFENPVRVFRAIRREERTTFKQPTEIVGRSKELHLIAKQIERIVSGQRSLTVIEGEAGVGKTLIVQEALYRASLIGCKSACSTADSVTQSNPYEPWRKIFAILFDVSLRSDPAVKQRLRETMERAKIDAELFPLMNDIFNLGIDENSQTKSLTGVARAKAVQRLFADVICHHIGTRPHLLVFEDVHWSDLPSLDLCFLVHKKCRRVGIFFTQRSISEGSREEWDQKLSQRRAMRITLKNFGREQTATLVRAHTAVRSVPRAFLDSIYAATEGNPFFVEQVLKSYNRQHARNDVPKARHIDLMRMTIPDTVEMAVLQRVDELGQKEQLVLKSASAIGDEFRIDTLLHAHTPKESVSGIKRSLAALIGKGFIVKQGDRDAATYSISHQLMRKVVYDLVPRRQLAVIHARIARWYESSHEGPRAKHFAQLAHHWLSAGVPRKALVYLSHAGERSLKSGAHNEARYFFQRALDLAGESSIRRSWRGGSFRLARWESQLSQALWGLGELDSASLHACRALRLVGFRVPETRSGWLALAIRQWFALPLPVQVGFGEKGILRVRRQALDSGAGAAIVIAQAAYYTPDALRMLAGSLLSLRLGSSSATGASVGRSYAYLGYMSGLIRFHRVAERLFQRAVMRSRSDSDVVGLAYAHGGKALYHLGFGRWSQAEPEVEHALTVCRDIGDPQLTEIALTLRAMLHYFKGEFRQSDCDFAEILTSARARLSNHHIAWGAYGRAENLLRLGKTRQAARFIRIARNLLTKQSDVHSDVICRGLEAISELRLGNFGSARTAAFAAIELGKSVVPNNFSSLEGYAAPIETLLQLQGLDAIVADQRYLAKAFSSMSHYARLFPIGRPRLWYLRGLSSHTKGEHKLAEENLIRSLRWSSILQMRHEEYRTCEALLWINSRSIEATRAPARMDALSVKFGYAPCSADIWRSERFRDL